MAISWELLAWAMPKILVVCITSTEKLGSQLAMRDPARTCRQKTTAESWFSPQLTAGSVSGRPTIKVEEVIVLVDVWPSFWSSTYWANVVFQPRTLLLVSTRSSVPINVQGCSTCGTWRVLLKPRTQARAEKPPCRYYTFAYCIRSVLARTSLLKTSSQRFNPGPKQGLKTNIKDRNTVFYIS